MKSKLLLVAVGLLCWQSQMASAQSLTSTTSIFNNGEALGDAVIDLQSLEFGGDAPVTIGPAPLVDYVLFAEGGVSFAANGSAPIIGAITAANTATGGASVVEEFSAILPDGTAVGSGFGVASSNLSGSVDLTGFSDGTVYLIYGSFIDVTQATATLGGASAAGDAVAFTPANPNQTPDVTPEPLLDAGLATVFGDDNSGSIVTAFDFDTAGGTFTDFDFTLLNADADGSRSGVAGVVVVANTLAAVPEPSSLALLGLLGAGFAWKRRRVA